MSTFNKLKNKFKKTIKKVGGSVLKPIKSIIKPEKEKAEPEGTRGEAAKQLMKMPTTRQAGSGQVSFTKEEEV